MNELSLFAGIGGGLLGSRLLGWRTVCAVEIEPFCIDRIMQRQNEGHLDRFPIWDDIRTFDGRPWRGIVDVVSGGFPCQDISVAGKGAGIEGERSGLWSEMARVIGEVGPRYAFVENSPMLTIRGLDRVLGDLAEMGYDAKWGCISGAAVGTCHIRERLWIHAYTDRYRFQGIDSISSPKKIKIEEWIYIKGMARSLCEEKIDSLPESFIVGKNDGMADRVDRTKAIGNGQIPRVAKLAWEILAA